MVNDYEVLRTVYYAQRLRYVKSLLDTLPVNYAMIKGEALSILAYQKTGIRHYSDIDILIDRKNLDIVQKRLNDEGFDSVSNSRANKVLLLTSSHQTVPWSKKIMPFGVAVVDLNFDIFWGEYDGERINIEDYISDTIELDMYGLKIKSLPPIKAFIQIVLHHYKDLNSIFLISSRNGINKYMFKEVFCLLKNNLDSISIEKLYNMSVRYGTIPYVFYVLYYTDQIFDDNVLKKYIDAFRTDEGERLLNCYGLCEKERKEWKFDFATRLNSKNLFNLIRNDLTERDMDKIALNKRILLGEMK